MLFLFISEMKINVIVYFDNKSEGGENGKRHPEKRKHWHTLI